MSSYKDLIAWQKGMELVAAIYDATEAFPAHEQFVLVSQLRRAAVSVPSNIAEGKAYYSNRDCVRFLRHARGSLAEIENASPDCGEAPVFAFHGNDQANSSNRQTGAHIERVDSLCEGARADSRFRARNSGLGTQD